MRTPEETVAEAQRLFDDGMPFHAHEVFEDAWKAAPDDDRALWQGLAQLAVALTHLRRGNAAGARKLFERGAGRIRPYADAPPYGLDVAGLLEWSRRALGVIDASRSDVPVPRLGRAAGNGDGS